MLESRDQRLPGLCRRLQFAASPGYEVALIVGDHVRIQNQTGRHPTKWDKPGLAIEVLQFDQHAHVVRVNSSGRITLCNRKFLQKYQPGQRKQCEQRPFSVFPTA